MRDLSVFTMWFLELCPQAEQQVLQVFIYIVLTAKARYKIPGSAMRNVLFRQFKNFLSEDIFSNQICGQLKKLLNL